MVMYSNNTKIHTTHHPASVVSCKCPHNRFKGQGLPQTATITLLFPVKISLVTSTRASFMVVYMLTLLAAAAAANMRLSC